MSRLIESDRDKMEEGAQKVRAHVFIKGRVQGVLFRYATRDEANLRGVKGWVRNLSDGRVEAVFEGDEEAVKRMISWCWVGPPGAKVISIDVEWEEYLGEYKDFRVLY